MSSGIAHGLPIVPKLPQVPKVSKVRTKDFARYF